jgi:hypothetical protein
MPDSLDSSYRSPDPQRPAVPLPVETEVRGHDPYAAFRFGDFALFTAGNLLSITGRLMLAVAVEWETYARTHSPTALGLVGLAIALPVVTLSLPAGHLADRVSRKHIILVSQVFSALTSLALALVSWKHLVIPQIAPLREGNRALATVAAVFERHHPMFHFDDASVPLIYLLLVKETQARSRGSRCADSYDDVLRALVLAGRFGYEDVTGLRWIEIDFPADVIHARNKLVPAIVRST